MHLSTVASKEVVNQYYGKEFSKSYYIGCSTGGRQGYVTTIKAYVMLLKWVGN